MKEVKAYVHRDRVADVIAALKASGSWGSEGGDSHNLAAYIVRSVVSPPHGTDRHYSTDLGDEIVNEYKLELICPDEEVEELLRIISAAALTGGPMGGWITVAPLDVAQQIG